MAPHARLGSSRRLRSRRGVGKGPTTRSKAHGGTPTTGAWVAQPGCPPSSQWRSAVMPDLDGRAAARPSLSGAYIPDGAGYAIQERANMQHVTDPMHAMEMRDFEPAFDLRPERPDLKARRSNSPQVLNSPVLRGRNRLPRLVSVAQMGWTLFCQPLPRSARPAAGGPVPSRRGLHLAAPVPLHASGVNSASVSHGQCPMVGATGAASHVDGRWRRPACAHPLAPDRAATGVRNRTTYQ